MDFKETMDTRIKALIDLEEFGRERFTIQCSMPCLPVLEDVVIDLGAAPSACRPALVMEECFQSMEKIISGMEEALSTPLPTCLSPPSQTDPGHGNPVSWRLNPPKGRPLPQLLPPHRNGGADQSTGSCIRCRPVNNGRRLRRSSRNSW